MTPPGGSTMLAKRAAGQLTVGTVKPAPPKELMGITMDKAEEKKGKALVRVLPDPTKH